ncbi:MAG: glycosyltransferase family 2 protein [Ignavibacteria bacterium]|nr:glycosyltransferase family 2 protein [Ignavibacteria bacterium]
MKSISVVIPNYNGRELLERNLPFVYLALSTSGVTDYEIIIPDDVSTDTSIEFLQTQYPQILVIPHLVNSGFGGNSNSGIFASSKELVLLLNTDVELTDGYFIPLMQYFDNPDTFGVMSRIIGLNSDEVQDGAKYPDYTFGHIGATLNYRSKTQSTLYTLFLSGANALFDRKKLLELGGFDELYNPYYAEDVDLSLRAWKIGYKCYYDDTAVCRHPVSATIKREKPRKVKIITKRNKMYIHYIHLEMLERVVFLLVMSLKTMLRALMFHSVYVLAYFAFIKTISQCNKSRKRIQELQQIHQSTMTLKDIRTLIQQSIKKSPITKF